MLRVVYRLPPGMTYEPPTAWNWAGPSDNACSYYPPQTDPFSFYATPQPRLPFFPDIAISSYSSGGGGEVDYSAAHSRLSFLGGQSTGHCGNGVLGIKEESQLENSNDRFTMPCCQLSTLLLDILASRPMYFLDTVAGSGRNR